MVMVYSPRSGYPFGGIILLYTVALVTLIAASALANEPYKFLRYDLLLQYLTPLNNFFSFIGMGYCTEMVNLLESMTSASPSGKMHLPFYYL